MDVPDDFDQFTYVDENGQVVDLTELTEEDLPYTVGVEKQTVFSFTSDSNFEAGGVILTYEMKLDNESPSCFWAHGVGGCELDYVESCLHTNGYEKCFVSGWDEECADASRVCYKEHNRL